MKRCGNYCGTTCINGYCPKAVYNELLQSDIGPDPTDLGISSDIDCENCGYYKGCEDCYFAGRKPSDELYCKDEVKE